MTNTEMWLDETISHIKSVKSDIWMLHEIMSLPNCNDCKNKDCEYKPKWGEHIRYNCPLHTDRKTENSSEKPNNCELQTIRCPKCGRTDYIRDMEKDMGIKGSRYKYKCINCNTYIKDEPQTEREGER